MSSYAVKSKTNEGSIPSRREPSYLRIGVGVVRVKLELREVLGHCWRCSMR